MSAIDLTAERLRTLLSYDPETGEFRWINANHNRPANRLTGCLDKSTGYIVINVDGKKRYAQRLAWLYVTGKWPDKQIDHWDLDKANNRFYNLRPADKAQQKWNCPAPSTNTSGIKGVSFHKQSGKFRADIKARGQAIFLGLFETMDAARAAWIKAAEGLHGEFARGD